MLAADATAIAARRTRNNTDHLGRIFLLPMLEFINGSCEMRGSVVFIPVSGKGLVGGRICLSYGVPVRLQSC